MSPTKSFSASNSKAKVFLVEDHALARFGLAQLINQQADLAVCGEADSVRKAMESVAIAKPDIAVVDLTLKNESGLELIKILTAQFPKLPLLVVSMHEEALYAELALHAGATGYIMKDEAIEKVLVAIRLVLGGKMYLSEAMTLRLLQKQVAGHNPSKTGPIELLSDRELEVLNLIGQWRRTAEIAAGLHLSPKTVEYYRQRIKEKLGLKDATELTHFATEWVHRQVPR